MSEEKKIAAGPGNFGQCLVEGSAEDNGCGRKSKRRAIAISSVVQSASLVALVIAPMLAKPAEIKTTSSTPIPPYRSRPAEQRPTNSHGTQPNPPRCSFCSPTRIPPTLETRDPNSRAFEPAGLEVPIDAVENDEDGWINPLDPRVQPPLPDPPPPRQERIVIGHIDPALLVNRVEPVFPALARQIRKNGKVELHAVIAADGTIQSLQVVSGDPLFVQSALDAVRRWRYTPTKLNGQPVEVDTFITVVYTVNSQ
jgi:protein TonB